MKAPVLYDPGLKSLLEEAARQYRRREDEAFRALMQEAVRRAPHRTDIRFSLASHFIQTGNTDAAILVYQEMDAAVPGDLDTLLCLAHWLRYAGRTAEAEETLTRLRAARPSRAEELEAVWRIADKWTKAPISHAVPPPGTLPGRLGIVVLGYVLDTAGSMQEILLQRLTAALAAAQAFPEAVLVLTGGVPRAGLVEAAVMRQWLTEKGVDAGRISEEGYARDVVENLLYSHSILGIEGAESVLLITSAADVHRAGASLEILEWLHGTARPAAAMAAGPRLEGPADCRLKLYRDTLRIYGIPMMRCFPELVER